MSDEKKVSEDTTTNTEVLDADSKQEVMDKLRKENEQRRKRSAEDSKVLQEKEDRIKALEEKVNSEQTEKNKQKEKEMKDKEQYKELADKLEKEKQEALQEKENLKKELAEASNFKNEILKKENEAKENILVEIKAISETQKDVSILKIGEGLKHDLELLKEYHSKLINIKPEKGTAYEKQMKKVKGSEEPLNYKTLDADQIQAILDSRESQPAEYERYLEQIKRSGWQYK